MTSTEPITVAMATVSLISGIGAAVATLIRQANRLALLEERVGGVQSEMRAEQARNEQRDQTLSELNARLARIEEKLDIAIRYRRRSGRYQAF
ncbi:hypothetical protein CWRG_02673 [Chthonomonas calidirosea]|uniref:Uncharacterized protein n=1 Tax=Chthonomonas calidirosea (strain DSM 23976 / ICMP 18418 / T49) TaxID=1303518 RepID=S0EU69_CHTCT|nr:hypothetical protein [Chthonomonas calidirosea]CCW35217.1 hypothetical protein CCALI_01400 [Chthonomonas calidirosea T49]CEK19953.1 hypothetical protein CWRG_02673 [Chthonomonas calidirosea]CEK20765.1 hypothetical protein CTKA_02698 [Chthonomonas calidirosea]